MSFALAGGFPTFSRPRKTATAGTVITSLIQPRNKMRTKITTLKYTAGTTAHTITILKPLAKTNVVAAVAAGGTSYILARDPGNYSANYAADALRGPNAAGIGPQGYMFPASIPATGNNLVASGDLFAVQQANGQFFLATASGTPVTAPNGQVTITLTAAPTGGVLAGADVYFFGTTTDVHPVTGEAHAQYSGTASSTVTIDGNGGEVAAGFGLDEPLLIHSDNSTAAGVLELATGVYSLN